MKLGFVILKIQIKLNHHLLLIEEWKKLECRVLFDYYLNFFYKFLQKIVLLYPIIYLNHTLVSKFLVSTFLNLRINLE